MPKALEIAGQRFGRLVAISYSHSAIGQRYWNCECDCGKHHVAAAGAMRYGHVHSCGCAVGRRAIPVEDRFWSKVRKADGDGCWEWMGARVKTGYGQIGRSRTRQLIATHRLSWELYRGAIPSGLCVCHRCDNPRCVRPDHLFLGTQADNIHDMVAKGRHRKSRNG